MLSRLSIQNYAIIERLEVDFSAQLNILTGETGAGKSIIVGALGLILGQRAESNVLLNRERKCIVEGCFSGESANAGVLDQYISRPSPGSRNNNVAFTTGFGYIF